MTNLETKYQIIDNTYSTCEFETMEYYTVSEAQQAIADFIEEDDTFDYNDFEIVEV